MFAKTSLTILLALTTFGVTYGWQDSTASSPGQSAVTIFGTTDSSRFGLARTARKPSADQLIMEAVKTLKAAEGSAARTEAKDKLVELLSQDYDARLVSYDKQIRSLEEQIVEMRDRLDRRRRAKDDMIELRIKVLEAEADDLGWPSMIRGRSQFGQQSFGFPSRLNVPAPPRPVKPNLPTRTSR